jgi:osmotically-inducible protein OsmY
MPRLTEEIKKDVVDQLYWDNRVDASKAKVEVTDGKVILTGRAPSFSSRHAAQIDALSVDGVLSVENAIIVKPPVRAPSDEEIRNAIENALFWDPDFDAQEMMVRVEQGGVTLEGTVDAYWKKLKAGEEALQIVGVVDVINKLAVAPAEDMLDKSVAEDVVAALDRNVNVNAEHVNVKVENGIVTLFGRVSDWNQFFIAQSIAQHTSGVVNVTNELVIEQ